MALRTNRLNAQGYIGGISAGGAQAWSVKRKDLLRNIYLDDGLHIDNKSGIPNGYNMSAVLMPLKSGGMSSYNFSQLVLTPLNTDIKMGKALAFNASSTMTVLTADLDQIIAMIASGAASIVVDQASLSAGVLMLATATGTLTVNLAQLGGIIPISATTNIVITPDVTMTALANMIAEAGGPTPLSPEGLAQAVWSALVADYAAQTGSMGEAIGNSSAAGNPWDALLDANQNPGTFGKHVQELLKRNFYLGTK